MSFPRGKQRTLLLPLPRNDSFIVADLPRPVICRRVSPLPSNKILPKLRRGGSSFPSLWISLWNFQLSFKREKEEGADLFHKCIGCDIIREGNESLEEKYIFSNIFAARIETASIPPDTIAGSVDPDREGGSRLVRLVYRYRTISRRFGDSVSYSEQRSLHLPILASAR